MDLRLWFKIACAFLNFLAKLYCYKGLQNAKCDRRILQWTQGMPVELPGCEKWHFEWLISSSI